MMKHNLWKKSCVLLLAASMTFTTFPVQADEPGSEVQTTEESRQNLRNLYGIYDIECLSGKDRIEALQKLVTENAGSLSQTEKAALLSQAFQDWKMETRTATVKKDGSAYPLVFVQVENNVWYVSDPFLIQQDMAKPLLLGRNSLQTKGIELTELPESVLLSDVDYEKDPEVYEEPEESAAADPAVLLEILKSDEEQDEEVMESDEQAGMSEESEEMKEKTEVSVTDIPEDAENAEKPEKSDKTEDNGKDEDPEVLEEKDNKEESEATEDTQPQTVTEETVWWHNPWFSFSMEQKNCPVWQEADGENVVSIEEAVELLRNRTDHIAIQVDEGMQVDADFVWLFQKNDSLMVQVISCAAATVQKDGKTIILLEPMYVNSLEDEKRCKDLIHDWAAELGKEPSFAAVAEQIRMHLDNWKTCFPNVKADEISSSWYSMMAGYRLLQTLGYKCDMVLAYQNDTPYFLLQVSIDGETKYFCPEYETEDGLIPVEQLKDFGICLYSSNESQTEKSDEIPALVLASKVADENAAAKVIRSGMKEASTKIQMQYTGSMDANTFISKTIAATFAELSGDGFGGDYLRNFCYIIKDYDYSGNIFTFKVYYDTTNDYQYSKSSESQLTQELKKIYNEKKFSDMPLGKRIKAIYDFVGSKVKTVGNYQLAHFILVGSKKGGVCTAYSHLFYRMCRDNGIQCRIVKGKARYPGTNKEEPHAWNIVNYQGLWYNCDAYWDAGCSYLWYMKGDAWYLNKNNSDTRLGTHYRLNLSKNDEGVPIFNGLDYTALTYYRNHPMAPSSLDSRCYNGHTYGKNSTVSVKWDRSSDNTKIHTAWVRFTCTKCGKVARSIESTVSKGKNTATCTGKGKQTWTAAKKTFTCDDGTVLSPKAADLSTTTDSVALGHNYKLSATWNSYAATKGTLNCQRSGCSNKVSVNVTVSRSTTAAKCTTAGKTVYTAKATYNSKDYTDSKTQTLAATGHSYTNSSLTPTWNSAGTSATAIASCNTCKAKTSAITGTITTESTTAATCTSKGTAKRKATFKVNDKCTLTNTKTFYTTDALGHDYSSPSFTWSGFTCTSAKLNCSRCSSTVSDSKLSNSSSVTKAATCTTAGTRVHKVTATISGKEYTAAKTETLAALGHSYGSPTFLWNGTQCTSTQRTCSRCQNKITDKNVSVTSAVTRQPGCLSEGIRTYTASAVISGNTYKDSKTGPITALGHQFSNGTCIRCGIAQSSVKKVTLKYNLNDGTGTGYDSVSINQGSSITLKPVPTRTGYSFAGWKMGSSVYNAGSAYVMTADTTAVAQWTAIKVTLSYNLNGGSGTGYASQTVNYGTSIALKSAPSRSSYTFAGWKVGSTVYKAGAIVKVTANTTATAQWTASVSRVTMYRLYNPNSGEHFYTSNTAERDNLKKAGWKYEGTGWIAPSKSKTPVYRLYNANAGDHHYTMNADEKDMLVKTGWKYEGIGWYSDDSKGVPLYRQYNPNAIAGSHNYTTSKSENAQLVRYGWKAEGIGWYGLK